MNLITITRKVCFAVLPIFIFSGAFAQALQKLEIAHADTTIKNSLYNKIDLLDARIDTTNLGTVQLGAFNRNAKIVLQKPLREQLSTYLTGITDQFSTGGQLVLRLTQYEAYEVTKSFSETGYCALQATLYLQNGNQCQKITSIDTLISMKSGMDVTKALLKATGSVLTNFIKNNLMSKPKENTGITYDELVNLDMLAKQKLRVYTIDKFVDGVYSTYQSFAAQTPDKPIKIEGYAVYPDVVKQVEPDGRVTKVKGKDVYAIVFMGTAYIATKTDYYEVKRDKNDLYFTGQMKTGASAGDRVAAGMMFGMLGSIMMANSQATFDMKVDYRNGQFIRLREVINSPADQ
ncbi:hypothetical protein [Mucilaginibacter boryungensis]|uniref:Curli production assembly/transport component CsgG n=1 Tax=Mucilaginibacter boryungensis TaxID=768480 RepID=A0ABR9XGY4_9SPHI|nr:hypothetical protein [Mucilaginibacter boryungensis]MBE9666526.1 hypothetical protein [Mucilaginibacter boryungensis]